MERYAPATIFGDNIVASEGAEWKKYRKITAPAFSEVCFELCLWHKSEYACQKNHKLVWDETVRIMMDLFDQVWCDRSEIVVDHCLDITLPVRYLWLIFHPYSDVSARLHFLSSARQVVCVSIKLFQSHQ